MAKDQEKKSKAAQEYYKLKTKAVDDLVTADEDNSPQVSPAELERYGARQKKGFPDWLKAGFIKFWFPGSVFYFMLMGLPLQHPLDRVVIVGIVLGMVTDLLTNNLIRFIAVSKGSNDRWLMFARERYATFIWNILYAIVLCAIVFLGIYPGIDLVCNLIQGTQGKQYLMMEPLGFGLSYMLCDMLLVWLKNCIGKAVGSGKNKNVQEG